MSPIYAFAVAGSLVAAIATWLILQFPGLLLWGAFIGWASLAHSGGDMPAFKKSITCNVFGVVLAWIVAYPVASGMIGLPVPLAAALMVAIVTPIIIVASKINLLSVVPATFYGFASSFAFLVQTPDKFSPAALTSLSLNNVLIVVPISLIAGALLGLIHGRIASLMISKQEGATAGETAPAAEGTK